MADFNYKQAKQQLQELLDWFEQQDGDIEMAIEKHEQTVKLIAEIEMYLNDAEAKININSKKK